MDLAATYHDAVSSFFDHMDIHIRVSLLARSFQSFTLLVSLGAAAYQIIFLEVLFGIYMLYLTYTTANVWTLIIGLSLILNPLVIKYDLESRALNKLLYLPFFLNIMLLVLISRSLE